MTQGTRWVRKDISSEDILKWKCGHFTQAVHWLLLQKVKLMQHFSLSAAAGMAVSPKGEAHVYDSSALIVNKPHWHTALPRLSHSCQFLPWVVQVRLVVFMLKKILSLMEGFIIQSSAVAAMYSSNTYYSPLTSLCTQQAYGLGTRTCKRMLRQVTWVVLSCMPHIIR